MEIIVFVLSLLLVKSVSTRDVTNKERSIIDTYNMADKGHKPHLDMDQAWLTISNNVSSNLEVFVQSHECYKCDMMYFATVKGETTKTSIANATFGTDIQLREVASNKIICSTSVSFREYGDYWLFLEKSKNTSKSCDILIANDPMAAEMPIVYVAAGLLVLWIAIKVAFCLYRKYRSRGIRGLVQKYSAEDDGQTQMDSIDGSAKEREENVTSTHSKQQRLKSLDTFRGISLMLMIFVNFGGGGYWFFSHPPWNGLTVADLVFPWFVFIMGTSMNYSFRSMLKRRKHRLWILWKVIRRAVLLFAFGIILNTNWGPVDLEKLRIPGVLQRLSLSYLIIALMETAFARREDRYQHRSWYWMRDIVMLLPEWIASLCILAAYLALTFALPVPGCPTKTTNFIGLLAFSHYLNSASGYIGPGGLHDGKQYENCTGGAAGYIDRMVLGENHIYGNPTPKQIYQTIEPYDPEGILGTLPSIFLCFLGLQAGRIFITYKDHKGRVIRLLSWAAATGTIGAGLSACSQNDGIIPLNKNLWSLSFIMITASFGYVLLCALYVITDIIKIWDGEPFMFVGMNPLILYICHDVFYRFFPVNWQMDPVHWSLLLKAVWDTAIFTILGFYMYSKEIFIAL